MSQNASLCESFFGALLLTTDIIKYEFLKSIILKYMIIIKYFKQLYKSEALLSKEITNNFIEGGG